MDRGGCRLNGGGVGGGEVGGGGGGGSGSASGSRLGMITLEDLETFSEEQPADSAYNSNGSLEEEGESMEEEEQDRLLQYWQDVGRGHQVDVPRDMAVPIQQLTSNNQGTQDRESVPFTLITRKEKCGDVLYEKRHYEKAHWACVTVLEEQYEQSICLGFMKLMRYICQQNTTGGFLGLTIPIVTVVRTENSRSVLSREVTVAYYLPSQHQAHPPQPYDPDIVIEEWPAAIIYTRTFGGPTNEHSILYEISLLAEVLECPEIRLQDSFIVAGYTNPAAANRHNEIWFLQQP